MILFTECGDFFTFETMSDHGFQHANYDDRKVNSLIFFCKKVTEEPKTLFLKMPQMHCTQSDNSNYNYCYPKMADMNWEGTRNVFYCLNIPRFNVLLSL